VGNNGFQPAEVWVCRHEALAAVVRGQCHMDCIHCLEPFRLGNAEGVLEDFEVDSQIPGGVEELLID
jgi:hypothetical protein